MPLVCLHFSDQFEDFVVSHYAKVNLTWKFPTPIAFGASQQTMLSQSKHIVIHSKELCISTEILIHEVTGNVLK